MPEKVLFKSEKTGCIDMVMSPRNPKILFAALWEFERKAWGAKTGGPEGGLWKSTDGGETWKEITGNNGMPEGSWGRVGLTMSAAAPQRVFAPIDNETRQGLKSQTQSFELEINPNEVYTRAPTDEKGKAWMALYAQSEKTVQAILKGLEAKKKAAEAAKANPALKDAAAKVATVADNFEASMVSTGTTLVQIISEPTKPLAFLTSLHNLLEHTEWPPNRPWYQVFEKYSGQIDAQIAKFDKELAEAMKAFQK